MAKQNSVIIDPGHGGSDPGAVYGNRREKDDTLALSYDIGDALERRGVRVEYTKGSLYTMLIVFNQMVSLFLLMLTGYLAN